VLFILLVVSYLTRPSSRRSVLGQRHVALG
jgi:hypothetical protein